MTNREYTQKCRFLAEENRKHGSYLRDIDAGEWPTHGERPERVLRSHDFLVLVYGNGDDSVRLTICRTAIDRSGQWIADIDWETLQSLKRQAGYGYRCAVEIFPPDAHTVNVANMRHLWVLRDSEIPEFMWRKGRSTATSSASPHTVQQRILGHCDGCEASGD